MNTVAILAGFEHVVVLQWAGWSGGEIVHADHGSHESTHGLCQGCRVEPFVQGTAFIRFKMAEADPANLDGSIIFPTVSNSSGNMDRIPV